MYNSIITEVHRYSKPENAFAFHTLERDESINGWVEIDGAPYREAGVDAFYRDDNVAAKRQTLKDEGYEPLSLLSLTEDHRHFVIHCQAPLEWHMGLNAGDPDLIARLVIWVKEA